MYQDVNLQFSAAQAITTTAVSTNIVDLGQARDMGAGDALEIDIRINTTFTGGTSLQVQLQTAAVAAFTTPYNVVLTDAIPLASLVAGASIPLHWDRAAPYAPQEFIRLNYVVVGTMTAGALTAGVVKNIQDAQNTSASGFAVI